MTERRPATKKSARRRPRERVDETERRAAAVLAALRTAYPDAHCALVHRDPLELLVATILSAQCTDVRVNLVTPALFARCPTPADYAAIPTAELEELVRSTGFFRNKARSLRALGTALGERHGGGVPGTMAELVALPGVGRKTANVVLGNAFGRDEGIVVDTHVARLAQRLGFTRSLDPVAIERDLVPLFPRDSWTLLAHLLIAHGRARCKAPRPSCDGCPLAALCPSVEPPRTPAKRRTRAPSARAA